MSVEPGTDDLTSRQQLTAELALWPATDTEQALGLQLFADSRPFLTQLPLPAAQLELLLRQQYQLQQISYRQHYPTAWRWTIGWQGEAAGQLWLDQNAERLHLIDITLLRPYQARGVGTQVLQWLQQQALLQKIPLQLWVENQNSGALRLYQRLGFAEQQSTDSHRLLAWLPASVG